MPSEFPRILNIGSCQLPITPLLGSWLAVGGREAVAHFHPAFFEEALVDHQRELSERGWRARCLVKRLSVMNIHYVPLAVYKGNRDRNLGVLRPDIRSPLSLEN